MRQLRQRESFITLSLIEISSHVCVYDQIVWFGDQLHKILMIIIVKFFLIPDSLFIFLLCQKNLSSIKLRFFFVEDEKKEWKRNLKLEFLLC